MEEDKAHELYTTLQGVDAGARFKQVCVQAARRRCPSR
jgi:hypothetical protein